MQYSDGVEGLAIFSKFPLETVRKSNNVLNQCAQRVIVNFNGLTLGFTNVHLTWESALKKRKANSRSDTMGF